MCNVSVCRASSYLLGAWLSFGDVTSALGHQGGITMSKRGGAATFNLMPPGACRPFLVIGWDRLAFVPACMPACMLPACTHACGVMWRRPLRRQKVSEHPPGLRRAACCALHAACSTARRMCSTSHSVLVHRRVARARARHPSMLVQVHRPMACADFIARQHLRLNFEVGA